MTVHHYLPREFYPMLELAKRLRDLKDLISPAYYDTLKDLAFAALAADWRTVHKLAFRLAEEVTANYLFGTAAVTAVPTTEADLDAALTQLEAGTVVTMAAADPAKLDPATWAMIITAVVELIKLIRDRRKP